MGEAAELTWGMWCWVLCTAGRGVPVRGLHCKAWHIHGPGHSSFLVIASYSQHQKSSKPSWHLPHSCPLSTWPCKSKAEQLFCSWFYISSVSMSHVSSIPYQAEWHALMISYKEHKILRVFDHFYSQDGGFQWNYMLHADPLKLKLLQSFGSDLLTTSVITITVHRENNKLLTLKLT